MNPGQIGPLVKAAVEPVDSPALQTASVAPVNVKPVQPTLLRGTRYSFPLPNLPGYTVKATFVEGDELPNKNIPYQYKFKDVEIYNKDGTMIQQQKSYVLSYTYNFPQNIIAIDGVPIPNIGVGGRLKKNRRSKHRTKKSTRRYGRKRKSRRFHRL
jgi:hypothetical protein